MPTAHQLLKLEDHQVLIVGGPQPAQTNKGANPQLAHPGWQLFVQLRGAFATSIWNHAAEINHFTHGKLARNIAVQ